MTTNLYILSEPDGGIRYVGKTKESLRQRFNKHLTEARNGKINHRCNWIRSLLSKGYLPLIQLIGEVEGDGCREEIAWIKYFRDECVNLVNGTDGGEGCCGRKLSFETIEKIRLFHVGRKRSAETIERLKLSHLGHRPTKEAIEKIRLKKIGKKLSEGVKMNMSLAQKGRIISMEHRQKLRLAKIKNPTNYWLNKKMPEEMCQKIRLAHIGMKYSKATKEKKRISMLKSWARKKTVA